MYARKVCAVFIVPTIPRSLFANRHLLHHRNQLLPAENALHSAQRLVIDTHFSDQYYTGSIVHGRQLI